MKIQPTRTRKPQLVTALAVKKRANKFKATDSTSMIDVQNLDSASSDNGVKLAFQKHHLETVPIAFGP